MIRNSNSFNTRGRLISAFAIITGLVLILILRLWYLQIVKGDYFRDRSENNRLRTVYLPSPRGLIFDRNEQVMVRNRPSYNIDFVVEDAPDPEQSLRILSELSGRPLDSLKQDLKEQKKRRRFEPKI